MATLKLSYPVDMTTHVKTQGFGENPEDYKQFGLIWHNGIDLAPYGQFAGQDHPVTAVDDGDVITVGVEKNKAGKYTGFGIYLELRHAWGRSLVAHLVPKSPIIVVGQHVQRGQKLALEDSTGYSSGQHVHLQIKPDSEPYANGYKGAVDPLPYLSIIDGEPGTELPPIPPPINEPIPGGPVKVIADELRMRAAPGLAGFIAAELKKNAVIYITASTQDVNGYRWRKLDNQDLYVAEISLMTGERYLEVYPRAD